VPQSQTELSEALVTCSGNAQSGVGPRLRYDGVGHRQPRPGMSIGPPDEQAAAEPADVLQLPMAARATDIALGELEIVYAFIYARVGNKADAEDLTQQVAMKAIPRLRQGAPVSAIRGYLFATARSVLGGFWSTRLGLSEAELHEDLALAVPQVAPNEERADTVQRILAELSDNYRRVLELRFLHGYSLKEVAAEMNSTVGAVKVMQLRALRAAAKVQVSE
jgi:RNA polymerase sigma factor (sigma-70 family)